MVGRITVVAIGAAGAVVTGLSVASATLWRPDDVLRASVTTDSPYVVTAPGVVEMGGQPTTVTAKTVDGKKVPLVVAVGRDTDVVGWVGDDPHETVTGMSGWSALRIANPPASATARPTEGESAAGEPTEGERAPDEARAEYQSPAGSDMWLAEATGEGRAELKKWAPGSQDSGRWSVLVANPTEAQTTIELAWPRNVSTPWLIPGLILGLGAVGWATYTELRRRGILTFRRLAGPDTSTGTEKDSDSPSSPRSRREVRAAQADGRSGPVPVVSGGPTTGEPAAEDWGTAAFAAPLDAAPEAYDLVEAPPRERRSERASTAWSPARTWQRARHSTEPDLDQTPARSRLTEGPPVVAPIQPPPASPARPRTPAWSRTAAPSSAAPSSAAPPVPAPAPAPTAGLAPSPAPSVSAPATGRRRAWPPASQSAAAPPPEAEEASAAAATRRSGPFGRSARPAPGPSPSAPTLGAPASRPAPPGGWMPGRGGRTEAVPQVSAPTEQTGDGGRPAWLGRSRSSASTAPAPAAPQGPAPQGTAPRLSTGPQAPGQPSDPPRGDAWRQIWGISTDDGSQEDR